jgi:hypothetical protein
MSIKYFLLILTLSSFQIKAMHRLLRQNVLKQSIQALKSQRSLAGVSLLRLYQKQSQALRVPSNQFKYNKFCKYIAAASAVALSQDNDETEEFIQNCKQLQSALKKIGGIHRVIIVPDERIYYAFEGDCKRYLGESSGICLFQSDAQGGIEGNGALTNIKTFWHCILIEWENDFLGKYIQLKRTLSVDSTRSLAGIDPLQNKFIKIQRLQPLISKIDDHLRKTKGKISQYVSAETGIITDYDCSEYTIHTTEGLFNKMPIEVHVSQSSDDNYPDN